MTKRKGVWGIRLSHIPEMIKEGEGAKEERERERDGRMRLLCSWIESLAQCVWVLSQSSVLCVCVCICVVVSCLSVCRSEYCRLTVRKREKREGRRVFLSLFASRKQVFLFLSFFCFLFFNIESFRKQQPAFL